MTGALLLAVDVGTLSARAGLFDAAGALKGVAASPFPLLRPAEGHAAYRMAEIWAAVEAAIRAVLAEAPGEHVRGLAFDATSSLVLAHDGASPLAGGADVFCWADHRGEALTAEIEASDDRILDHMGGSVSPELHLPKLLWLRRQDPAAWARITAVRDLCDELARRATGLDRHSLCGLACKWPYLPGEPDPWRRALLERLGLAALPGLGSLGAPPLPVGALHGRLTAEVAARLGLPAGLPVAAGLIDAEAGTLGAFGAGFANRMNEVLALIGGTSTCFMAFAPEKRLIPGVWGPFRDAVFPGLWLHEAGQSLTGAALDAVLEQHPAGPRQASAEGHAAAAAEILRLLDAEGPGFAAQRHIVPDWLGNRSPLGDGRVRALATGIGEERERRSFLEAYYATARALALQARHITEHLNAHGYAIRRIALSGGHARNPLLLRLYRDALGAELALPRTREPVLLGTAMVAAVAAGLQPDLFAAMDAMDAGQEVLRPDPRWARAHDIAYGIYRSLFAARSALASGISALGELSR